MARGLVVVALMVLSACPNPSGPDGGGMDASLFPFGGGGGGGVVGGGTGAGGFIGTGGGPTIVSFADFCAAYLSGQCFVEGACGLSSTREACAAREAVNDPEQHGCVTWRSAIAAGRIVFNEFAAADCVNSHQMTVCAPFGCRESALYTGNVPLDGGCFADRECAGAAWCDFGAHACPGRCTASASSAGEHVPDPRWCRPSTFALPEGDGGFTCKTVISGGSCRFHGECAAGMLCDPVTSMCTTTGDPRALSCALPDGGPSAGYCGPVLTCAPVVDGGAECQRHVLPGAPCFPQLEDTCRRDARCLSTDGGAAVCVALGDAGEPCTWNADCALFHYCRAGACAAAEATGAGCDGSPRSCASGRCDELWLADGGSEYRCVATDGGPAQRGCFDPTP